MADPETETETRTKPAGGKGKGARARIEVDDIPLDPEKASDVLDAAGGRSRRGGGGAPTKADAQKFSKAVRDPNNKIVATRQQPPTLRDGTALGDTYEIPTHETQSEQGIKRDISEARGGRTWILRVYDPDENIIASKSVEVPGEPRMDPMMAGLDNDLPGGEGSMETETDLTEQELLERELARDPEVIKAQKSLRLKQLANDEEELEVKAAELRARRIAADRAIKGEQENGNGNGKHKHDEDQKSEMLKAIEASNAPLREANAALQKRLDDAERRSAEKENKAERRQELEAMMAPLKTAQEATQKALDAMMQKMSQPAAPTGPTTDTLLAKLDAMKAEIKSDTKDQITAAINQVSTTFNAKVDNLQTLLTTMKGSKDDPAVTALINLATGAKGGGSPNDPFSQVDKLLTVLNKLKETQGGGESGPPDFPSYLVEKIAETTPEVLNFFREQRGAIPSKDEIEKMMRNAAMKMYEGLDASMKKELAQIRVNPNAPVQNIQQQTQPAQQTAQPGPSPAPASVGPTGGAGPTPTVADFPAGPGAPAAPGASSAAAPAATSEAKLTPDRLYMSLSPTDKAEYKKRIDWVLGGLLNEMRMGVREMKWPEKAHGNLPKAVIDQLVEAEKDTDIHDIVKHYADPKILDSIWEYLKPANPQHEWYQGWLADGLNWIKQAEGYEIVEPDDGQPPVVEE